MGMLRQLATRGEIQAMFHENSFFFGDHTHHWVAPFKDHADFWETQWQQTKRVPKSQQFLALNNSKNVLSWSSPCDSIWYLYRNVTISSGRCNNIQDIALLRETFNFLALSSALIEGNFMKSSWRWQIVSKNSWQHLPTVGFASLIISRQEWWHSPVAKHHKLAATSCQLEQHHAF